MTQLFDNIVTVAWLNWLKILAVVKHGLKTICNHPSILVFKGTLVIAGSASYQVFVAASYGSWADSYESWQGSI